MSSSTNSPLRFNGTYDSFYTDAAAAVAANNQHDINNRMKVPKRIRLTGQFSLIYSMYIYIISKIVKNMFFTPKSIIIARTTLTIYFAQ